MDTEPFVVFHLQSQTNLIMMTSSNGSIFRVTGPLCGEFTGPHELCYLGGDLLR